MSEAHKAKHPIALSSGPSSSDSIIRALGFKDLPKANQYAVAHLQPKTQEEKMLYSITTDGRIKLHRDLSKWKAKTVGKGHSVYFSEAPSPAEEEANRKMQKLIRDSTQELTFDQECAVAVKQMKRQEQRDALVG